MRNILARSFRLHADCVSKRLGAKHIRSFKFANGLETSSATERRLQAWMKYYDGRNERIRIKRDSRVRASTDRALDRLRETEIHRLHRIGTT